MGKFINANNVKELLIGLDSLPWEEEIDDIVDQLPVSDVQEVKHGKWLETGDEQLDLIYSGYKCSECGFIICGHSGNYCSECGAKMDGKR